MTGEHFNEQDPSILHFESPLEDGLRQSVVLEADALSERYHTAIVKYLDIQERDKGWATTRELYGNIVDKEHWVDEWLLINAAVNSVIKARASGMSNEEIRAFSEKRLADHEVHKTAAR